MKIISKFKDYYDYFQGIYGMDEKLVLDRTEFYKLPYIPSNYTIQTFWICDYKVQGIFIDGEFLYGKEIDPIHVQLYHPRFRSEKNLYYTFYHPDYNNRILEILKFPILFQDLPRRKNNRGDTIIEHNPNTRMNCPILLENNGSFQKFPILSDYQFHKVFTSFQMWTMLTEWLGREKKIENNQSNKEKILSNGFDLKTSFRHPVK